MQLKLTFIMLHILSRLTKLHVSTVFKNNKSKTARCERLHWLQQCIQNRVFQKTFSNFSQSHALKLHFRAEMPHAGYFEIGLHLGVSPAPNFFSLFKAPK